MPDRLEAIEIKLAHLERAVAEISDVVARQQKELDRALDRNQRLMEKIAAIESESGASADRAREATALLIVGLAAHLRAGGGRTARRVQEIARQAKVLVSRDSRLR